MNSFITIVADQLGRNNPDIEQRKEKVDSVSFKQFE